MNMELMPENNRIDILIVDDREENLLALEACLGDFDLNIVKAKSGNEALARMLEKEFALVLLDVQMPGMDGFEVAELMRGTEMTKRVPIIFVTAISKEAKHIFRGYEAGAVDYIFKPPEPHILRSKVGVFIQLYQHQKELKEVICELRKANEKIKQLSILDSLTGCYNRGYLNDQLPKEIKRAMRSRTPMSLILSDIDHFKNVNDCYGHQCGDAVLKKFVDIMQTQIRKDIDWISRYGGEEFVVVLPETELSGGVTTAERLRLTISEAPILYKDKRININASFGVTVFDSFETEINGTIEKLLHTADERLYEAKRQGRNCVISEY